ncbi:hypothetical protein BCR35DRAFT_307678 [Leucosporidium creatinivorum]|uniref:Uncharacterized protein n=1 Tax=Leucosporidium creatinivorum TaxID=106004 RepID=A0A1Y2ELF7_9BASI|nr:hypothetical protein BCR35DRAFT_307678 [Leucosporidium creatinivorum]
MATISDRTNDYFSSDFPILGGVGNTGGDDALTMMFVAFYACCIGIGLWRLIKYPTARTWILFRPALVIALRIAGNVVRYMEATSNSAAPNKGRVVAEQILIVLGYFFISDAVLVLLETMLAPCSSFVHNRRAGSQNTIATWVLGFCHIALIPAVVLGCYAVGTLKWLREDSPEFATIGRCRLAGAAIFLAMACIYDLAAIYAKVQKRVAKWRSTIFLFAITVLTTIPPAYMVAMYRQADPPSIGSAGPKTAFYCLTELPILLVTGLLLGIHLPKEFGFGAAELDREQQALNSGKEWSSSVDQSTRSPAESRV